MDYGIKYKLPSKFNINYIIKQFKYDIGIFIYKIAISYNKLIEYFN